MNTIRQSADRGRAQFGWLDSYHSFSFGEYHDAQHMGWGPLRVINEDRVAAGQGFGTHGHRDMEILTYVLSGAVAHKDSMGNGSTLRPGGVQLMSAGTGVQHSEFNPDAQHPAHFLQIWIQPKFTGTRPNYQENEVPAAEKRGVLRAIVSPDGRQGSLTIGQDAIVYAALVDADERIEHALAAGRRGYVQVARGAVTVNGHALSAGDALMLVDEPGMVIESGHDAEILVFDMVA